MRISRSGRDVTDLRGTGTFEPAGDGAIIHQLVHALLSEPELDQCGIGRHVGASLCAERPAAHASWWIELYVENGDIALDGTVPSLAHKNLVGEIARHVAGARAVVNALNVEPPQLIRNHFAWRRQSKLHDGQVVDYPLDTGRRWDHLLDEFAFAVGRRCAAR